MNRQCTVIETDSDSNSSSGSSVSSSSSSNSNSSSSSSENSSDSEDIATEPDTVEQSGESVSEDTSNQSSNSVSERAIETNNNQLEVSALTKPAKIESQPPFAKEEDSNSNSSDSRSRGYMRRSPNIPPFAKKKKPSFEESLLNIDQMYKKNGSPIASTNSPNASNSSPAIKPRRFSTNCRPNVIINVNNNREAPRKLIIPSYKIFDQTLSKNLPNVSVPPRTNSRTLSRSSSSSSGSGSGSSSRDAKLTNCTQRSSGLIRVNYPNKPSPSARATTSNGASSRSRAVATTTNGAPSLDQRIPYVMLERIDYEELLEQYHKQQKQQQQQQFSKLRQRRKSTFS